MLKVLSILFIIFLFALASFIFVLFHERRTLWSGMTLTATLSTFAIFALVAVMDLVSIYKDSQQ